MGRHELELLAALGILAAGGWVFIAVAQEVAGGEARELDRQLLLALRNPNDLRDPIGPVWVEEAMRDLTALGGSPLLTLFSVAVVTHLALRGRPRAASFVALSAAGGALVSLLLKHLFDRPRPDLVPQLSAVMTSSFPSGHSMGSAAIYLTLSGLLARFEPSIWLKTHVLLWGVGFTVLVGVSRVYLGVHWPTDVLAGWSAGATWAALCWFVARMLQRRGRVEAHDAAEPRARD